MAKLMVISVEGKYLVARSPVSEIELARVPVKGEETDDHIAAGLLLIHDAFESLNAEGYPRALDIINPLRPLRIQGVQSPGGLL